MPDIKLFVCCHQNSVVPQHKLLVPIQVGSALALEHFQNVIHDDDGENISHKNRSYCELTAQYWAWKNVEADYYGFFHYRRYLYPSENAKMPYVIKRKPTEKMLQKLQYGKFEGLIQQYDLIAPKGENMFISVREHYANAEHHHIKDLELAERIVAERYPEMKDAMERYLSGTVCYFGNIYIMRREVFRSYCDWLFSILEEFDRRSDFADYTPQELRVNGYLAERLFGVYYTHLGNSLRTAELPRVHFYGGRNGAKRNVINALLPPGSRLRSLVKEMMKI